MPRKRYDTPHRSRVVRTRMTEDEAEVRAAASDLSALKFEVLEKVGEADGNVQTYQL